MDDQKVRIPYYSSIIMIAFDTFIKKYETQSTITTKHIGVSFYVRKSPQIKMMI